MVSGEPNPSRIADQNTGYALQAGRLAHISEVSRGLACQCVCIDCHQSLIARKGRKRRHHFAHKVESNCQGAAESALHLLSKELIGEMTWMELPPYHFTMERKRRSGATVIHEELVAKGGRVRISSVHLESREQGFIADVLLNCFEKKLIVEIAVTHKVDRKKLRHIRRSDLPALEIYLHPRDALLPRQELRELLQNRCDNKRWLFHPRQRAAERAFIKHYRNMQKLRHVSRITAKGSGSWIKGSLPVKSLKLANRFENGMKVNLNADEINLRERLGEEFRLKHHRYPNMEECLQLWPKLWGKTAKGRDLQ